MRKIVFLRKARLELREAKAWYETEASAELAEDLGREIIEKLQFVCDFPELYQEIRPGYRRLVLTRFPYAVTYRTTKDTVFVLAVVNQARHPSTWLR